MHRLKDIAARMDCHPRTAKRWWKKLRVPPDVIGHGPHRWHTDSFNRLIRLWELYYQTHGTTPQLVRAKYAGQRNDKFQLELLTWKPKQTLTQQTGQKSPAPSKTKPAGTVNAAGIRTKSRRATS
jgi:hypothetical protein